MMSFPSGDLLMDIILWIWGIGCLVCLLVPWGEDDDD